MKFVIIAIVTLVSYTSFGQVESKWRKEIRGAFNNLDKNKDNVLTNPELIKRPLLRIITFRMLDTNNTKQVEFEEFLRARSDWKILAQNHKNAVIKYRKSSKGHFNGLDLNKDGILFKEELKGKKIYNGFERIDIDKDGKITYNEFAKEHALWFMTKEMKGPNPDNKKNIKTKKVPSVKKYIPKPRFKYEKFSVEELFTKFDTNNNGEIEREEAKTENSFNTDFSRMDKNGDEELTKKELQKYLESK